MYWGKGSVAEAARIVSNSKLSDLPRTDSIEVKLSTISGLGIFAVKDILPETLIISYSGRIVGPKSTVLIQVEGTESPLTKRKARYDSRG